METPGRKFSDRCVVLSNPVECTTQGSDFRLQTSLFRRMWSVLNPQNDGIAIKISVGNCF